MYQAHLRRKDCERRVYCSSATVFCMSLVLILAKFLPKLAASVKAPAKRTSTACLPPYFWKRILRLWAEEGNVTSVVEILVSEGRLTTRVVSYFLGA